MCLFDFNFLVIFIMKIKVSVVLYCIIEGFFYVFYEKLKFWIKCLVGYFFKFI